MTDSPDHRIGTAAWTVPKEVRERFASEGSHLERYAGRLNCVEINTSFYRDHKPSSYAKWAATVPENFRFSVKLSRVFTQERRLESTDGLDEVVSGIRELGRKLGVILVQLPPSLGFVPRDARHFLTALRRLHDGGIALEPRHAGWGSTAALRLLGDLGIAKVVADPERVPLEPLPRLADFEYFRLHGSPEIYKSDYSADALRTWHNRMESTGARKIWCVFDNTTFGYATRNALEMRQLVEERAAARLRSRRRSA